MTANSVTESSENGSVDYTAHPPPPPPSEKPAPAELSTAQAVMHEKVLENFRSDTYKIPGIANGALLEEEKFWLVRLSGLVFRYHICKLMVFVSSWFSLLKKV